MDKHTQAASLWEDFNQQAIAKTKKYVQLNTAICQQQLKLLDYCVSFGDENLIHRGVIQVQRMVRAADFSTIQAQVVDYLHEDRQWINRALPLIDDSAWADTLVDIKTINRLAADSDSGHHNTEWTEHLNEAYQAMLDALEQSDQAWEACYQLLNQH